MIAKTGVRVPGDVLAPAWSSNEASDEALGLFDA
jgi:hypothetical protein